jgi:hypothetical protein
MLNEIQINDDKDTQPEAIAEEILHRLGYSLRSAPARDCFQIVRCGSVIAILTRREIVNIAPTLEQEKERGILALDALIREYSAGRSARAS